MAGPPSATTKKPVSNPQRPQRSAAPAKSSAAGRTAPRTSAKPESSSRRPERSPASSDSVTLSKESRTSEGGDKGFVNPLSSTAWGGTEPKAESPREKAERSARAEKLIRERTGMFGLDESRLGSDLAAMSSTPSGVAFGNAVFDKLGSGNLDDVSSQMISKLNDDQLKALGERPEGKAFLQRTAGYSNSGWVSEFDGIQAARAGRFAYDKFGPLMDEKLSDNVRDAIKNSGSTHQKLTDGSGPIKFDEHRVTIDKMPKDVTPEQFLGKFARDPNSTVDSSFFDTMNRFSRRSDVGDPKPGDIYDIDILGPDNGDVVLKEVKPDHIDVATLTTPGHGAHPEYGYRRFGFEKNDDGSVDFYTLGVSRADFVARQGGFVQDQDWQSLMNGWARNLQKQGATVRPNSVRMKKGPQ